MKHYGWGNLLREEERIRYAISKAIKEKMANRDLNCTKLGSLLYDQWGIKKSSAITLVSLAKEGLFHGFGKPYVHSKQGHKEREIQEQNFQRRGYAHPFPFGTKARQRVKDILKVLNSPTPLDYQI